MDRLRVAPHIDNNSVLDIYVLENGSEKLYRYQFNSKEHAEKYLVKVDMINKRKYKLGVFFKEIKPYLVGSVKNGKIDRDDNFDYKAAISNISNMLQNKKRETMDKIVNIPITEEVKINDFILESGDQILLDKKEKYSGGSGGLYDDAVSLSRRGERSDVVRYFVGTRISNSPNGSPCAPFFVYTENKDYGSDEVIKEMRFSIYAQGRSWITTSASSSNMNERYWINNILSKAKECKDVNLFLDEVKSVLRKVDSALQEDNSKRRPIIITEEVEINDVILEPGDKIYLESKKALKESISMEGKVPYDFYADKFTTNMSSNVTILKRNNEPSGQDMMDKGMPYTIEKFSYNKDGSVCFCVLIWNDVGDGFYTTWFAFDDEREATQAGW